MTSLQSFCPQPPCGIWSVFFSAIRLSQGKNISMAECFGLSSKSAGFAGPMFRVQIAERRKAPLPSLRPWLHADGYQIRGMPDPGLGEPCARVGAISDGVEELAPTMLTSQSNDGIGIEFGDTKRLFAKLLFQQIRPRNCLAAEAEEPCRAPAPHLPSRFPRQPRQPVTTGQKASSDSAAIETSFTELARRWLHRLAAKERP